MTLVVFVFSYFALRYEWNNALFDFSCINYRGMVSFSLGESVRG
ncbi:hypothetical protein T4D_10489 [Trichinella pseudospiralis]|uniref:Uncharacterized protein n=1 Tax=Trichinella pseudospiralis TaxID=6337 RepID=A0A0V1E8E4_TRIPS|nr:hypothetical protein T4D_10489 [Trichinella pseudospiralis]